MNSLRIACNQRSSRDPVTDYSDETVSEALLGLKRNVLVTFVPYGSQGNNYKYRHFLEDPRFKLQKREIAVLAVLLLRGSQTLNEIRLRASSLVPLANLEETEAILTGLADRTEPLVVRLPKRPGWKEPRWRDLVREELASSDSEIAAGGNDAPGRSLREEVEDLQGELANLKADHAALKEMVEKIRSELY